MPLVGVLMGSSSDEAIVAETVSVLDQMGIENEVTVASAHRTPERVMEYVTGARDRGIEVLIAAAGGSAGLPGRRRVLDHPARHRHSPSQQRPRRRGRPLRHRANAPRHSRRLRSSRLLGRAQRRLPSGPNPRHQARQHPRRLRRLPPIPQKPLTLFCPFPLDGGRLGWG